MQEDAPARQQMKDIEQRLFSGDKESQRKHLHTHTHTHTRGVYKGIN